MITKDTLTTVTPAAEAVEVPAAQTSASTKSNDSAGLRADAVSLEVPVRVHGSHVIEAVKDNPARTEPFEETTATMIIFPQGAVLRMATPVSVAQMIVVTNLKSGQDAICRIVKVRAYGPNQSYVEAEFTHRQVGYWGVQFASDPAQTAPKISLPKLDSREKSAAETAKLRPAQDAPASSLRVSSTVGPGSRRVEDSVAGAASGAGREVRPVAAVLHSAVAPADLSGGDAFPAALEASSEPLTETRESSRDESGYGAGLVRFASSGSLAGGAIAGRGSRDIFAARTEEGTVAEPNGRAGNKVLMIGGAAAAAVLAAGAYFFFHAHAARLALPVTAPQAAVISEKTAPAPVVPSIAEPSAPAPVSLSGISSPAKKPAAPNPVATASSSSVRSAPRAESAAREADAVRPADSAAPDASSEASAPHRSAEVPSLFGVLNAHPVAPHSNAGQTQAAPEIDSNVLSGTPASVLPGIATQGSLTAPKLTSVAPRLIASVPPQYPALAEQMNVQGSVHLVATIEPNGTVGQVKVISGPGLLREAAAEAVRRWKYEPGRIGGQPTQTQINVTVTFSTGK